MIDVEALVAPAFLVRLPRRHSPMEVRLNAAARVRAELAGWAMSIACPDGGSGQDDGALEAAVLTCAETRAGRDVPLTWPGHGGPRRWRASLAPVVDDGGCVLAVLGLCHEVEPHGHGSTWAGDHLSLALQAIHGAEWRYDVATGTYQGSDEIATLIGERAPRRVAWAEWLERVHPQDLASFVSRPAHDGAFEFRFQALGGAPRWGRCSRVAVSDARGQIEAVLGIMVDITQERMRETALAELATHDPLTGLLNRLGLQQETDRLQANLPPGQSVALFAIDLDHFKTTNDEHGHAAGDAVLVEASRRLRAALDLAVCARLGGDEFVAILPVADPAQGERLRERLWQEFRRPLACRGRWLPVAASVGVAHGTGRVDFESLMVAADADLYADKRAKASGSKAFCAKALGSVAA